MKLMTCEQVSKYHPDKYADQISDALLTEYLKQDKNAHCGIETLVKNNTVIIAGEVSAKAIVDVCEIIKRVAKKLNYRVSDIVSHLTKQSQEINTAVIKDENIGAGDQGIMFGYATNETSSYLPKGFETANKIIKILEKNVTEENSILKGDAKTQVTIDLESKKYKTIVISACHKEDIEIKEVRKNIYNLLPEEYKNKKNWLRGKIDIKINPSGLWTIGGPTADCGLTGRKIVCDQYGGYAPVGGGAFSGKDPSKVDRSATYMAREIAIDLIKKFEIKWAQVQLSYAIGLSLPISVSVKSNNSRLNKKMVNYIRKTYDLTPKGIIKYLDLYNVDYEKLAEGCHFYKDGK